MSIFNYEKRQKLISEFLNTLSGVEVEDREIIIRKGNLTFVAHMFQTNIDIFLSDCFQCPLDCNKSVELYVGKTHLDETNIDELEVEDLLLLSQIKDIVGEEFPVDSESLQNKLKTRICVLNFGLVGFDQVGKSTIFELVPGKAKKNPNLIQTYKKEITTFSPLKVNIYDYGTEIMENLTSKSPAPLLLEKLRNFYLYIVVTDSTPQNVTNTKQILIPKLKKLSPYAAIIVIANMQDLPGILSPDLVEKIIGERTYPLSALDLESNEFFSKLLNEIILLRRDQMQEFECPFLDETLD